MPLEEHLAELILRMERCHSFKRPESYRTRGGEAAHRAWAGGLATDQRLRLAGHWTNRRNWLAAINKYSGLQPRELARATSSTSSWTG